MELKRCSPSSEGKQNSSKGKASTNPGGSSQCQNQISGLPPLTLRNRLSALVVDDYAILSMVLKAFLLYYGVETQVVENGMDTVDLVASGATFDVIFIDMNLPVLDGLEAIRQIRTMGMRRMIVGMTYRYTETEIASLLSAGADKVIEKPLFPAKLVQILMEADGQV